MYKTKLECDKIWDNESLREYTAVDVIKKRLRKGNSVYLQRHPEIRAIIRVLLHELINKKPMNIYNFSAALFNCNNSPLLATKINQQLKRIQQELKKSKYGQYDGEFLYSQSESKHSLFSQASINSDADNILGYALLLKDGQENGNKN